MSNKIDWSKAYGATIYAGGKFWRQRAESPRFFDGFDFYMSSFIKTRVTIDNLKGLEDFEINPDAVLLPCQDFKDETHGDVKLKTEKMNEAHTKMNEIVNKVKSDKPYEFEESISVQYLNRCKAVQHERGKQYDSKGTGERSFDAAAQAFNALTGEKLKGSDVCLLLTCLKVVRQNSDNSRVHDDSLLDGISYLSLWAEELTKEIDNA